MKDLKFFLKQNVVKKENEEVEVSKRFKDDEGNLVKFEIKAISNDLDDQLRKDNTYQKKVAKGIYKPELDSTKYMKDVVTRCLVYPDLNNKDLQDSYEAMDAAELIDKMLLPGEYNALLSKVQEINGWNVDIDEIKDEVKN